MPWKECAPMDEKLLFIADHLRGGAPLSELCRRYGISRKTAYKWVERYRQLGMDGLQERSRRPHGNNQAISYAQRRAIIELRTQQRSQMGPKKLHALLLQRWGPQETPSKTTIYNVLKAEGLVCSRRVRRRSVPTAQPLRTSKQPNRKSTRLNSSHTVISYAVFCLKKKKTLDNYGESLHRSSRECHTHRTLRTPVAV